MTATLDFDTCVSQLAALGLRKGDAVLVRTALAALGPLSDSRPRADFLIDALLETVGPDGLLLGLAFTRNDRVFPFTRLPAYTKAEPSITGGFVAAMLARPGAFRSAHPTNSFVAIGRNAGTFLAKHDHNAACFAPMADLIARNGKMLLVGCMESSPGFSTVHLAQHDLGLDTRTWMSLLVGRRYLADDGRTRWYRKRDIPGCSMGFGKFYEPYRRHGVAREGPVGEAQSMLVDAKAAYAVEHALVAVDPSNALCDRDGCLTCRLGWYYKPIELRRYLRAKLRG